MAGTSHRLAYQPALDGLRALAVIAVVLFHAGTPGFGGGYLGVSVFFTLSGYLITTLLVREHEASGTIGFGAFYGRRIRRLAPASMATLAAIVALSALTDVFDGVVGLRDQVVGALLQISNWVLLAGDTSYQDLLAQGSGAVSPLEHFWSLAIEEQFYWIWPPLVLTLLTLVRTPTRRLWVVGLLTAASMIAAPVIAHVWGPDAAYWATPSRLGEILVGAFLAFVLRSAAVPGRVSVLAPVCLGALTIGVVVFPTSSGPAYDGLLPLVAVVSGGLILGLQVDSPLRRALSCRPLVAIGLLSYGIYLVHWPVFVVVDSDRTGLAGPALTAVRLLITGVIAVGSHYVIERPIRLRRRSPTRITIAATVMASVAILAVAMSAMSPGPVDYWQLATATVEAARIDVGPTPPLVDASPRITVAPVQAPVATRGEEDSFASAIAMVVATAAVPPAAVPARPIRIVVTGDSTGEALGTGVVRWAAAHPDIAQAEVHAALGCGFVPGGDRRWGDEIVSMRSCDGWVDDQLYPAVERTRPDVVVVMTSTWDIIDRRWDGEQLLTPNDAEYRLRLVGAYTRLVDDLTARGAARVVFVNEPVPNVWWDGTTDGEADPARHAVLAEVYREIAASRPSAARVVDLASWFSGVGGDSDRDARPDGIHLAPDSAESIMDRYLSMQLLDITM